SPHVAARRARRAVRERRARKGADRAPRHAPPCPSQRTHPVHDDGLVRLRRALRSDPRRRLRVRAQRHGVRLPQPWTLRRRPAGDRGRAPADRAARDRRLAPRRRALRPARSARQAYVARSGASASSRLSPTKLTESRSRTSTSDGIVYVHHGAFVRPPYFVASAIRLPSVGPPCEIWALPMLKKSSVA